MPLLEEIGLVDDGTIWVDVGEEVVKVMHSPIIIGHHLWGYANRMVQAYGCRQLYFVLLLCRCLGQGLLHVSDVRSYASQRDVILLRCHTTHQWPCGRF